MLSYFHHNPQLVDEAHMQARVAEMGCVDISPEASPDLSARGTVTTSTSHPREVRQSTPGEVSHNLFCCYILL